MLVSEKFIPFSSSYLESGQCGSFQKQSALAALRVLKDADPDIPILKQAKVEYAKLQ
jgi:hypothetical protein